MWTGREDNLCITNDWPARAGQQWKEIEKQEVTNMRHECGGSGGELDLPP